jgi:hypothetical protein
MVNVPFLLLVDLAVNNPHILSRESPACFKITLKEYILELPKELLSYHNSRKKKGRRSVNAASICTIL